jgi:hypothetical protein
VHKHHAKKGKYCDYQQYMCEKPKIAAPFKNIETGCVNLQKI